MHYTSLENIHKVIDPLFLDDLKAELADIKAITVKKTRKDKARQFQDKLASLKFLDPACGSGNFLTESNGMDWLRASITGRYSMCSRPQMVTPVFTQQVLPSVK